MTNIETKIIEPRFWDKRLKRMIPWKEATSIIFTKPSRYVPLEFTGLLDDLGTKIYDGDLLIVGGITCVEGEVRWNQSLTVFEFVNPVNNTPYDLYHDWQTDRKEVIGNRYEGVLKSNFTD